jgi:HD superfamily phosphodiesterase
MNLTVAIESAELNLRQILEEYFVSVYNENDLPSHGLDHHRRVWKYATELLTLSSGRRLSPKAINPSKLIIACYLHDAGMSADPGPRHGVESRKLCMQFLKSHQLNAGDYSDVLNAVENHDRKEYLNLPERDPLLTILSVADDLDAFGYAGIYRYSEIYLARDQDPAGLGQKICDNARKRFDNFFSIFGREKDFTAMHRKRYDILNNFFFHYNQIAGSYYFNRYEPEGYGGIIQLIMHGVRNRMSLHDFLKEAELYPDDVVISSFIHELKMELDQSVY